MSEIRERVCVHCARPFQQPIRRGSGPAKYCSNRCKWKAAAKKRAEAIATLPERTCYKCQQTMAAVVFGSHHSYCRACNNEWQAEWARNNPERRAEFRRRSAAKAAANDPEYYRKLTLRKFGLSLESFDLLLQQQRGQCAICQTDEPGGRHQTWHIDHDRTCCPSTWTCGRCIRGLLCQNCNLMLGQARDESWRLLAGARYLMERQPNFVEE